MSAMEMVSYAQRLEDVRLNRVFGGQPAGSYVDVGAGHPIDLSVTKHFYEAGWRGINVEPVPYLFDLLCADRPRDANVDAVLSDHEGTVTLYEVTGYLELSTVSADRAAALSAQGHEVKERSVPTTTLARVCRRHVEGPIDFLKIDVEGSEVQVLLGADLSRWRPRVVLVEATEPESDIPSYAAWEGTLIGADYLFAAFDGLNRFYVRAEDRELVPVLATPMDTYVPYQDVESLEQAKRTLRQREVELQAERGAYERRITDLEATLARAHAELSGVRADLRP